MELHGQVGDEILVDTMDIGQRPRHGQIIEVLGEGDARHYRVRWEDGHESSFYPGSTSHVLHPGERTS